MCRPPRGDMSRLCRNAWLHGFVTEHATYYAIDPTRSAVLALLLLGEDYSGTLIHDGWSVYDRFGQATRQQCLAHVNYAPKVTPARERLRSE
ncbi:transposase [bacterium]|nr:transposase [bacterium]